MTFWDQIKKIFAEADSSSPSSPTIHELIQRSEEDLAAYGYWKSTAAPRRLLDWLSTQYTRSKDGLTTDNTIGFLDTQSSKGFVMYFREMNYNREEITHFFHYLKERVLTLNYRSDISDRRIFPRNDWIETQERHYLKPNTTFSEVKMDQAFGNIMIEFELRNELPHNLRLRATVYNDALYEAGGSFGGLVMALTA
ncbi:hypothetical protein FUA23_17570 [Neolewinella aurantiaca]|uniref:Uncharacterized protein n=1 Tax=Neolewinella aurantiaca TaxID=2602767 RepID=A0A5C7FN15_9BACT|nr:hypothetical protein [Neolewinella aurantiaca]TXF87740.1 hypothetical protein FUA23_17570 [Neolewinella aurantiaca]